MNTINIKLYDIFRKDLNLPDVKARELVEVIQETTKLEIDTITEGIATKEFVRNEITGVRADLTSLRVEPIKEIKDSKVDTIKWMFAFWVGTIGIALLFYFLKK